MLGCRPVFESELSLVEVGKVSLGRLAAQPGCWALLPPGCSLSCMKQDCQVRLEQPRDCWEQVMRPLCA